MSSQEVLQEAMAQYDGTIIIVSHNRHFVNSFVDKVLEIKNGCATLYEGNIEDYLYKLKNLEAARQIKLQEETDNDSVQEDSSGKQRGKAARQEQAKVRQEKSRKINPLKKEVEQAEENIAGLETRKNELEQVMADPELYRDQDKFAECSKEYISLERKLKRMYQRWEEVQAKIDAIEAEFEAQLK
jgi:ATP-binding cassette subfamily F protein 3